MQTDYIDLYQIHWPNHELAIEDSMAMLIKLRDAGKFVRLEPETLEYRI
ncbi:MAG: aldo/keto reductase [Chloroflexi bacterium]|nr:aldo/keto reductase [Chloroflexota bacterium]